MKKILRRAVNKSLKILMKFINLKKITTNSNSYDHLKTFGNYISENGKKYDLLQGYRDLIVPGWEKMLQKVTTIDVDSFEILQKKASVNKTEKFLNLFGYSLKDKNILEIGCHGGIQAYSMAEFGAKSVVAIDIPEYGVRQTPDLLVNEKTIVNQSDLLTNLRYRNGKFFNNSVVSSVAFNDLDVSDMDYNSVYDVIVSWETLEHINNPVKAFDKMFKALKPGGVCFHEYNPFFCESGGHSLCTLDFPYGHCRLSTSDFKQYIKLIRPNEKKPALDFYENNLNCMSLSDLRIYIDKVGFEILSLISWVSKPVVENVKRDFVLETKENYPSINEEDLFADMIWVLIRKP